MRTFIIPAIAAIAIPMSCGAQGAPEHPKIHIAAAAAAVSYVAPFVALSKGYFKDEGLDVSIANFQSGVKALNAVIGGSSDIGLGSYGHMITMASKGQKIKTFVSFLRCPGYAVLVRNGLQAHSIADLKGMKIGVSAPGASTDQSMKYLMVKAGLKPDDYTAIGIGNSAGSVAAVAKGMVDATIVIEPVSSELLSRKVARLLVDMRGHDGNDKAFGGEYPEGSLYASDQFIHDNPKTIQALTNAIVRANKWLQTAKPAEVVDSLPKEFVGEDKSLLENAFGNIRTCLSPDGLTSPSGAQQVFNIMSTSDSSLASKNIDLDSTYTNQFVNNALKKSGQ
ncbi:MAG TPA: ABC transporter substrate-binding protein [Bordetella sp.]|jgi:NitT/TauT family transport system substrate-binding protein|nr:ABC transporter substrate-binding protein [Bordetella sp.]